MPSDTVTSILEDSHHTIWISGAGGLSIYQPVTDNFKTYRHNEIDKTSLTTNEIEDLFEDRSGALWIATSRKGIEAILSNR